MFIGPWYPFVVSPVSRRLRHRGSGHPRSTRLKRVSRFASGIVLSPHNVRDRYLAGYRQCIAFHGCTSPFSFFFPRSVHLVSEHLPRETRSHLRKSILGYWLLVVLEDGLRKNDGFLKVTFFRAKMRSKGKGQFCKIFGIRTFDYNFEGRFDRSCQHCTWIISLMSIDR